MIKHGYIKKSVIQKSNSNGSELFIQPKLTINQSNDSYEQEANSIAERAVKSEIQPPFFLAKGNSNNNLQRKCAACEEEEKLQLKSETASNSNSEITSSGIHQVIGSTGKSLDCSTKDFMETRFGYDFSGVQIHNDQTANQSSADINAKAYTHKNHIVFGAGQYQPETTEGKRLLAHELTHVVQQGNTPNPIIQRKCTDNGVKTSDLVSVKNQHDFAALDGYTPIKGKAHDVYFDGKYHFFCYHDKRVYFKYVDTADKVIPDFQAAYGIKLENDGGKWLKSEVVLISEALSMLNDIEAAQLKGYRFIKQAGVMIEDGDRVVAALTTQDIIQNDYRIEFWKFCFDGTSDTKVKNTAGVSPGVPCILHEIGHALMYSRSRPYMEAMYFKDKYQKEYDKASADKQKGMKPKLDELKKIHDEAEAIYNKRPSVASEFLKLVKDKPVLTDYSKKNEQEAFAEAFAIYKINPDLLKARNRKLYEYFKKSGFQ
ncbi:DUF4157 domain-containing protein [Solitalea sp. MAHUQ-68]|uniref:DUF4157 domain-containing protein n=1 Tax=Solitalea agri TaxID=2953739 RepID=A0A9X2F462_9SPHI|nr:DUF4157 domain-containing protein [Solitalea agri]MCO4294464.1 DUF4157 domain-containing protein [Solitalea agri]